MKQYLLGNLTDQETLELELRIIADKELEESLIVAEESLIEEFLDGELTEEEKELFHKNFLISEERILQVKTIAQLKRYARDFKEDTYIDETRSETEKNFFLKLLDLLKLKPALAMYSFVFLALIAGIFGFYYFSQTNGLTDLEREYVELNQKDFKDLSKFDEFSRIVLAGGQTRSSEITNELIKRKMSEKVLFNLALPAGKNENEKWTVELIKNNRTAFTQTEIPAYQNEFGSELRFVLPAKILELGKYELIAKSENESEKRVFYSFSVR